MPLRTPQCVFAGAASAQHDAKISIFSFCERDLNKVALTELLELCFCKNR